MWPPESRVRHEPIGGLTGTDGSVVWSRLCGVSGYVARGGRMGDGRISVGNVEVRHVYDLIVDFPVTLDQLFPTMSIEAWEPYRREYPDLFGPGNTWRWHAGCFLIRSQ